MNAGPMLYVMLGIIFAAVVLFVMAVGSLVGNRVDLKQRLATEPRRSTAPAEGPGGLRRDDQRVLWARLVSQVEGLGVSLKDSKAEVYAEKLLLAGYPQPWAVRTFVLARAIGTLALPAVALGIMLLMGEMPKPTNTYMILIGAALLGLYLPTVVISRKAEQRRVAILNGFPDTLDLLLVCVEAGLGIDACFQRVGMEMSKSHPLLAELLAYVTLELRAGRSREQALRNLAKRSGVAEISAFATLVIQADKLGSSIAQALKVYAAEMREARRMRAEEKAHKLPVLMSVPLVCFMLPTMVGVLMLPAAISMKGVLGG